jgi:hypothetical protein
MKGRVHIPKDSLLHFVYNVSCIMVAAGAVAAMRTWPNHPAVFWAGMGALVIAYMAYRWQNPDDRERWDGHERRK